MQTMNLKEPRRKKNLLSESQTPLPIRIGNNKNDEWIVYTAHLGALTTSIVEPEEMVAVHAMGFFGKGLLSRSIPIFGGRKSGVPPLIRERQWKRHKEWLEEANKLHSEVLSAINDEAATEVPDQSLDADKSPQQREDERMEIVEEPQDGEITEVNKKDVNIAGCSKINDKSHEIDEVVLDSTEDEDIYEVDENIDSKKPRKDSQSDDIFVLSDNPVSLPLQLYDDYCDVSYDSDVNEEVNLNEVIVLPDSDSDTENYLNNIKPRIETDSFPITETLRLTFEETFFLMYGLGCLQLVDYDGKLMSIIDAWNHFNSEDNLFVPKYIVYHYFRSKGWVVKPGLQFGSDFLLYKNGPSTYHASYIVLVETIHADSLLKNDNKSSRKMSWSSLSSLNRLATQSAKELLIAQVMWPSSISITNNPVPLESLAEFTVREILWRRWKANAPEEVISDDEYDDDNSDDSS